MVSLKLQQLLKRTHDRRTPTQALERLCVSLTQLSALVNTKEVVRQCVDLCCSCGVLVADASLVVACSCCVVRDVWMWGCEIE